MTQYKSESSKEVKLVTTAIIIAMLLLITSIILNNSLKSYFGIITCAVIILSLFYFYTRSLNKVTLEKNQLILKRNIGSIEISLEDIRGIKQLNFSNIPMTVGSMGFFGYVGSTMDNSIALVNDRNEMIKIYTTDKNYILSCEKVSDLMEELEQLIK